MTNYKKKTAKVKLPFTYKGEFYKKDSDFKGTKKQIDALTNYLK